MNVSTLTSHPSVQSVRPIPRVRHTLTSNQRGPFRRGSSTHVGGNSSASGCFSYFHGGDRLFRLWSFTSKLSTLSIENFSEPRILLSSGPDHHDDPLGAGEEPEAQRAAPGHPGRPAAGGRQQVLRRLRGQRYGSPAHLSHPLNLSSSRSVH